jgi:spermidine/putrescine ABC transporter ATP-binding subunit
MIVPVDIELARVSKRFGDTVAVREASFVVERGEFLTLLGPSGCGKTTTLNMVAGFIHPTAGVITIQDRPVTELPPYERDTGMVFQSYALFPHMSVFDNVAFGLRMRKVTGPDIQRRVGDILERVQLAGLDRRYPRQLSGGQQQRVALARAMVLRPAVLLLDEPLSNLDLKLREAMRFELKSLQRELGITSVYVTHDQDEALVMSDRIAVMNAGHIEQIGPPEEIYASPSSLFVARFIGATNLLEGTVDHWRDEVARVRLADTDAVVEVRAPTRHDAGDRVVVSVRPERCHVSAEPLGVPLNRMQLRVEEVLLLGPDLRYHLAFPNERRLVARALNADDSYRPAPGDAVHVTFPPRAAIAFPAAAVATAEDPMGA